MNFEMITPPPLDDTSPDDYLIPDDLVTIYEYDPDTGYEISETKKVLEEGEKLPPNSTLTPQPEFDIRVERVKYVTAQDKWIIESLTSPLDELKFVTKGLIDREFNKTLSNITTLPAHSSGLYDLKYAESLKFIEDGEPSDLTNYPFLEIEVLARGTSAIDCANTIIDKHDSYALELSKLEKIRIVAKANIDAVELSNTMDIDAGHDKINEIMGTAIDELRNLI